MPYVVKKNLYTPDQVLSMGDLSTHSTILPFYPFLLSLHCGGHRRMGYPERNLARAEKNFSLPSLGRAWL
jgi:hypothetical protein